MNKYKFNLILYNKKMENNLYEKNFKVLNKSNNYKNIFENDPINQIKSSLDQLLSNLKNNNTVQNDCIENEIFNDSNDLDKDKVINNYNASLNNEYEYENNIYETDNKKVENENLIIPSENLIEKLSQRQSTISNKKDLINVINLNNLDEKETGSKLSIRSISNKNKNKN